MKELKIFYLIKIKKKYEIFSIQAISGLVKFISLFPSIY